MEESIKNLENSISTQYLNEFQNKLNEVLSFCESPIEKLMLLQLYNYFQKYCEYKDVNDYEVEFLLDSLDFFDPLYTMDNLQYFRKKSKDKKYRTDTISKDKVKYFGFKVYSFAGEGTALSDLNASTKSIRRVFEIYPQYDVFIENKNYRVDIVIILKRVEFFTNEIVETKKIAIECDGYDYHVGSQKFREDRIRERALRSEGFKEVLRYSGSEIYSINDNLTKTHYVFEEIIRTFMVS